MTKDKLLEVAQPIALTADEVRELDNGGRHSFERPIIIKHNGVILEADYHDPYIIFGKFQGLIAKNGRVFRPSITQPKSRALFCEVGDTLCVREVWSHVKCMDIDEYIYRATERGAEVERMCKENGEHLRWVSACAMPKTATRHFLRVTNVNYKEAEISDPITEDPLTVWAKVYEFERIVPI